MREETQKLKKMLNKTKDKTGLIKKKNKDAIEEYEDNLKSMRSWVRKIEQSSNSISSRLAAVEKRLSGRKYDPDIDNNIPGNILEGPIERVFASLKEEKLGKDMVEVSKILDSEFNVMQDEIVTQQTEITGFKNELEEIEKSIVELKADIVKTREAQDQYFKSLYTRVEKIEKHTPLIMKLGRMEVPIEIAGVVAGGIALFAALMVAIGNNGVLVSPVFLGFIGMVFILSTLFKTMKISRPQFLDNVMSNKDSEPLISNIPPDDKDVDVGPQISVSSDLFSPVAMHSAIVEDPDSFESDIESIKVSPSSSKPLNGKVAKDKKS